MPSAPASNRAPPNVDAEVEKIFEDDSGNQIKRAVVTSNENDLSEPLSGSYSTPATQRIGVGNNNITAAVKSLPPSDVGGDRKGAVTQFGTEAAFGRGTEHIDAQRQGKNVTQFSHFARMNLPLVTVNREFVLNTNGTMNFVSPLNLFGIPKLFKTFNPKSRRAIPFEDFPGRLDPAKFVEVGDYVLQYMILTDLTRDIDQFVNPDDQNGSIEVFEIRDSFANTGISDLRIEGVKASMSNESFYAPGQGSAPIENRYEIKQSSNSIYEDAQDALYQSFTFGPKKGYIEKGVFPLENPVSDENRKMSPFDESSNDEKVKFANRFKDFVKSNGGTSTTSYKNKTDAEMIVPELGTRYRSSNAGFIGSPNYVIIAEGRFINAGTDSIAFSGLSKT